jgi:hypothetical protein
MSIQINLVSDYLSNSRSRILQLTIAQLVKIFPAIYRIRVSQELTTGPRSEPDKTTPLFHTRISLKSSNIHLRLLSGALLSGIPTKILCGILLLRGPT